MFHRSDDELLCDQQCPAQCTCHGLAFTCSNPFPLHAYPQLRYLQARGSNLTLSQMAGTRMLVYISLAACELDTVTIVSLPNAVILDLSENRLSAVPFSLLGQAPNLRVLFLALNPLVFSMNGTSEVRALPSLRLLDLSQVVVPTVSEAMTRLFPNLHFLNLSYCHTQRLIGRGFQSMNKLRVLDMRGCPLQEVDRGVMEGLSHLQAVYADNYKLCCAAVLTEGFNADKCQAPVDEVSSCRDLLHSSVYRACLAALSVLALLGNAVSLVFRLVSLTSQASPGFSVFVLHLCTSDFLMGVYLSVLGVADHLYQDHYVWREWQWRHGHVCRLAGFLSLLSCEVFVVVVLVVMVVVVVVVVAVETRTYVSAGGIPVPAIP